MLFARVTSQSLKAAVAVFAIALLTAPVASAQPQDALPGHSAVVMENYSTLSGVFTDEELGALDTESTDNEISELVQLIDSPTRIDTRAKG